MKSFETFSASSQRTESAFTRLDLLVAVLTLALVTFTLLPALARTHVNSQGTGCLNNLRQITMAWIMYADDSNGKLAPNRGAFPPNPDYYTPPAGITNRARWVGGDMRGGSVGAPYSILDVYNTDLLVDPEFSALGPYVRNPLLFKCPADLSTWLGQPRVRTYSMNCAIGCAYNGTAQDPGHSAIGYWLTAGTSPFPWKNYLKKSDLTGSLAPADLMVLVEEHPDSINDSTFDTYMPKNPADTTHWVDVPSKVHHDGADFSFADGHAEIHPWKATVTIPPLIWAADTWTFPTTPTLPGNPDMMWIAHHSSALTPGASIPFQP